MTAKYIRVASDLHLEQYHGSDISQLEDVCLEPDDRDSESILVLAGDISSKPDQLIAFIELIESRFRYVIYVPGNHEYYRHEMSKWIPETRKLFEDRTDRVSYALGEDVVCHAVDGVRFIFTTMWTAGGEDLAEMGAVGQALNDFRIITLNGERFTVPKMSYIHKKMKAKVEQFLQSDPDAFNVVVTHHMPSYRLCHPRFGNTINGGFAFNGDAILAADYAPKIWIHGHTHDTVDKQLFNTRIVCNPRGYHREFLFDGAEEFNQYRMHAKFIELETK